MLYAEASAELRDVAELLGAPVMTTLQGKSAIPEAHPLAAGVGALSTTAMAAHYLQASDCVLAVGSSLTRAPFTPGDPGTARPIVHATNDPIDINKEYAAALGNRGRRPSSSWASSPPSSGAGWATAAPSSGPRQADTIARIKREWHTEYEPLFADDAAPINGYRMMRELWALLDPETSMLTHESGASRDIQSVFYESGTASQLFGLGAVVAARLLARPRHGRQTRQPGRSWW